MKTGYEVSLCPTIQYAKKHATSSSTSQSHCITVLQQSFACCLLHAGILLGLLFDPDGEDMLLQNDG
jgi:hypothetical protein